MDAFLLESLLVVVVTTVGFWAVAGLAAANRSGRSLATGALVGGLLPGFGWLLVLPSKEGGSTPWVPASSPTPAPLTSWSSPRAVAPAGSWSSAPTPAPAAVGTSGWSFSAPSPTAVATAAPVPMAASPAWRPSGVSGWDVLGLLAFVALLAAFIAPWLRVGLDHGSLSYRGFTSSFTALPLGAATVATGAALGLRTVRFPRLCAVAAALAGTTSLLVGAEVAFAAGEIGRLLRDAGALIEADPTVGSTASLVATRTGLPNVHASYGAALLCIGGVLATAWAVVSLVQHREGA